MRSALVIDPRKLLEDQQSYRALEECLSQCGRLARALKAKVSLTWQHNIRDDHFAIMIETPVRTFGNFGLTFADACRKTEDEIARYLKDNFDEKLRPKKKQASRKASRKGRGRSRTTG